MAHLPDATEPGPVRTAMDLDQGGRLRHVRTLLGLSQESLARRMSVSFATVNRWERGHSRMSAAALARLDELEASLGPPADANGVGRDGGRTGGERLDGERLDRERLGGGARAGGGRASSGRAGGGVGHGADIAPLTRFFGWEGPLRDLAATAAGVRLVTVTGPAGSGKSRFVAEAARRIELAGLTSVRVVDGADRPAAQIAAAVTGLLERDDGLLVLVASRLPIGMPGERLWPVPRLSCPPPAADIHEVLAADAVVLFADRARAARPDFAVTSGNAADVGGLCRDLDGYPLGIEEAASWAGTMSPAEMRGRLGDLLARGPAGPREAGPRDAGPQEPGPRGTRPHAGGIAAALAASHRELPGDLAEAIAALAVFAGSFGIEDAAAVTGASQLTLIDRLRDLAQARLIFVTTADQATSYRMPRVLRDFAAARWPARQRASLRSAHARYFARIAAASKDGLTAEDRAGWIARLDRAAADFDAALDWALATAHWRLGLVTSAGLWWWWLTTGQAAGGRRWLATFLAHADRVRDAGLVCAGHNAAAALAAEDGDYPAAVASAQIALAMCSSRRDHDGAAIAATALAAAQRYLGQQTAARDNFEIALHHRRLLGERQGLASALNNLALVALDDGALATARELLEESIALKRQLGDPRAVAIGLANLSDVLLKLHLVANAAACLDEAAEVAASLADGQLLATIACNRGDVAVARGQPGEAVEHYLAALDGYESAGGPHDVITVLLQLATALEDLGRRDQAIGRLRQAETLAVTIGSEQRLAEIRPALTDLDQPLLAGLPDRLTLRQAEILRHIALGESNRVIAESLHLSLGTVERHLSNIYGKISVAGRVEATRYALAHGLAPRGDATR